MEKWGMETYPVSSRYVQTRTCVATEIADGGFQQPSSSSSSYHSRDRDGERHKHHSDRDKDRDRHTDSHRHRDTMFLVSLLQ